MSQSNWGTMDPFTETGTDLANDLNAWRDSIHTMHSGTSVPSYAVQGTIWEDTTAANVSAVFYHDGTNDIKMYEIQRVNNTYTPFVLEINIRNAGITQEWIAGLDGSDNFQIKDKTGSNVIPFLIEKTAPTNSLVIEGAGSIGFGVVPPSANAQVYIGDTGNLALKEQASDPASQDSTYGVIYVVTTLSELRYQDDGGTSYIIGLDGKTLVWTKMQRYDRVNITSSGGTLVWDMEDNPHVDILLTENITTFTINNIKAGSDGTIEITQENTTARSVAWPSARIEQAGGGAAPTMTQTLNAVDLYSVYGRVADKGVLTAHQDVKAIS